MKRTALMMAVPLVICFSSYAASYDAIVSHGSPGMPHHYSKITQALAVAKQSHKPHFTIFVKNGTYIEKFSIRASHVTLIGENRDKTIIQYTSASGMKSPSGKKWGTSKSFVVRVKAGDVTLKNMTIRNTFDYPANDLKAKGDSTKLNAPQAVALSIGSNAKHAKVENVLIDGYQDSLMAKHGSVSYFKNCTVKGNVDFIFGGGTAVFDHCSIIARHRARDVSPMGYISAPSTDIHQKYGLVFINSRLLKEPGVPKDSYGLGRPWHPTRTFKDGRYADPNAIGATLYYNCYMDDHLYGWDKMSGWSKDHQRKWFYPDKDARFVEYHSFGPGAKKSPQRPQLTEQQAKSVSIDKILGGTWYKS
ncbi:MAG: Pectinesterase A [Candidatus Celerinatantimonas neptuna]|nr:MAG: Pectinesterase A [Candidatus Celerinatantimonas neptuna]